MQKKKKIKKAQSATIAKHTKWKKIEARMYKTYRALEDWSKKVKSDTIAKHQKNRKIGARRRRILLLQSNRRLDQEVKRVLLSQSTTTSEWGSTTKRIIALTILLLS